MVLCLEKKLPGMWPGLWKGRRHELLLPIPPTPLPSVPLYVKGVDNLLLEGGGVLELGERDYQQLLGLLLQTITVPVSIIIDLLLR